MTEPERALWTPAAEALYQHCYWIHGRGWFTHSTMRRSGEEWKDTAHERYEGLSSPEAYDVLVAHLDAWLLSDDGVRG